MLEEGKPGFEKNCEMLPLKSFIQLLAKRKLNNRGDSGNTYMPPDATIIEDCEYSTILTAAWF